MTALQLSIRCGLISLIVIATASAATAPQLVPANNMHSTDGQGFNWDVQHDGSINDGTSDCFDGGMHLQINGQHFQGMQPMMVAGTSEYVLNGQIGGVNVTRRLRLDPQVAAMRFVEVFENPSSQSMQVQVMLTATLGGSCNQTIMDDGTPMPGGPLADGRLGLVAVQSPGHHRPSVIWHLAGTRTQIQPQIQVHNNRNYTITFPLTIPASGKVALVHSVAQRRFQSQPTAATFSAEFAAFTHRDWTEDLPADVRRAILNGRRGGWDFGAGAGALSLAMLDVDRGSMDILATGENTRMQGTASAAGLAIIGRHGRAEVELDQVAALVGDAFAGDQAAVLLDDGQVLTGALELDELRFTLLSGMSVELDVASLDRLVRGVDNQETDSAVMSSGEPVLMITTTDGQRLALDQNSDGTLDLVTAWARIQVPVAEVLHLAPDTESGLGWLVALQDGSRFSAYLGQNSLSVPSQLFGELQLSPAELVGITRSAEEDFDPDEVLERQPHLRLAGEQVLVGRIDLPVLRIRVGRQVLPLAPDQIRHLERDGSGSAFTAQMWGQDVVAGDLFQAVLPIRSRGQSLSVPLSALREIVVPIPRTPEGLRERLNGLITQLGDADWRTRDAAAKELISLGALAYESVREARETSTDPEVRFRAEQLMRIIQP